MYYAATRKKCKFNLHKGNYEEDLGNEREDEDKMGVASHPPSRSSSGCRLDTLPTDLPPLGLFLRESFLVYVQVLPSGLAFNILKSRSERLRM